MAGLIGSCLSRFTLRPLAPLSANLAQASLLRVAGSQAATAKATTTATATHTAFMSYDASNKIHQQIDSLIKQSPKRVFVFMKGQPEEPQCGYSGMVVQLLKFYKVDFDACDVLANEQLRQQIKSYSDWPTIPQVYVDGSFLGGCDILLQMHQSGELKPLLEKTTEPDATTGQGDEK